MDLTQKNLRQEAADVRKVTPMLPAVDIVEDADRIVLRADMPGVSKDNLSIGIDGDTLTIEGAVGLGESARMNDVYAEIDVAQYRRAFTLGPDLDKEKVEAALAHGVLTLTIPKAEQARPRRITVKAQ
ncbi:MAG TPA: Hsp20/alpha crystallin family protein [Usitatibacter sp.]|nr:Hsp20/alpha crystallin family protein [Usitatibacter sp.]